MVTRKPLPEGANPDPGNPPARLQDLRKDLLWSPADSDPSSDDIWAEEQEQNHGVTTFSHSTTAVPPVPQDNIPAALRPGVTMNNSENGGAEDEENVWAQATSGLGHVPIILKPGGSRPGFKPETNPFKRKPPPGSSQQGISAPPMPQNAPPAPPIPSFSNLINEPSNNPWKPALEEAKPPVVPPLPTSLAPEVSDQDSSRDAWGSREPSRKPSNTQLSASPAIVSLPSEEEGSAGWEDEVPEKILEPLPPPPTDTVETFEDEHAWDDLGSGPKGKVPERPVKMANLTSEGTADGWNLIDNVPQRPAPPSRRSTWENFDDDAEEGPQKSAPAPVTQEPNRTQPVPNIPPRRAADAQPASPTRPPGDMTETYQVKNITWFDETAAKNPRVSPILVQNANGPCPLVALVNALTLTTPAEITNSALVETLRSREQVSLGLLLDAVFDELMSPRRTHSDATLPDVTELYAFLQGLHTGMNVNPRFVPTDEAIKAFHRTSLTHLHPTERTQTIPGTFEDTREMRLYATFSVPLIHGWIPASTEPVYDSFKRRAVSYEDVQNLLFQEEELEHKLSSTSGSGLTEEEQKIYQDILTIKSFFSISATQLTPYGLDVISSAMKPGSVAILFRNDHFSTLYRHPQTLQLLALVTDAGYAGHAEVVWETLVDVNGLHSEFLSGDFRLVGGPRQVTERSSSIAAVTGSSEEGWTTVQGRHTRGQTQQPQTDSRTGPGTPQDPLEQEDRDLALALQLQEEEDERHRAEQERRRRESQLSEQFIEQQGRQPIPNMRGGAAARVSNTGGRGGLASERRSSNSTSIPVTTGSGTGRGAARPQNVRSLVPPTAGGNRTHRPTDGGADDAPPTYEQAAKTSPYVPPVGHPSHPSSSPSPPGARRASAPGRSSPMPPPSPRAGQQGRGGYPGASGMSASLANGARLRQGMPPPPISHAASNSMSNRDKDCVVM